MADWKRKRCAEVLVPNVVSPDYLRGGYVYSSRVTAKCKKICPEIEVEVYRRVYFA